MDIHDTGVGCYMNVGRHHFAVCHPCRKKRYLGSNLFSCWKDETEEEWEKNARLLETFTDVNPPSRQAERSDSPTSGRDLMNELKEKHERVMANIIEVVTSPGVLRDVLTTKGKRKK
jgi:hypothetical protein